MTPRGRMSRLLHPVPPPQRTTDEAKARLALYGPLRVVGTISLAPSDKKRPRELPPPPEPKGDAPPMTATQITRSLAAEHTVADRWAFRVLRTVEEVRDELQEIAGSLAMAVGAAGDLVDPGYSPSPERTQLALEDVLADVELLAKHVRARI